MDASSKAPLQALLAMGCGSNDQPLPVASSSPCGCGGGGAVRRRGRRAACRCVVRAAPASPWEAPGIRRSLSGGTVRPVGQRFHVAKGGRRRSQTEQAMHSGMPSERSKLKIHT